VFTNIIGHEKLKSRLAVLLSKLVVLCTGTWIETIKKPESLLFYGPPNTGKRTVAFECSKYILCSGTVEDGCSCPSCRCFPEHPDLFYTGRNKILVQDIEELKNLTFRAPLLGKTRIFIIDNSEQLSSDAADRLLKAVEESGYPFIFITSDLEANYQTIRSRCLKIRFDSLTQEDLTNIFLKKFNFELAQARILGWLGSFSSFDIFSYAGLCLKLRDLSVDFAGLLADARQLNILEFIDKIDQKDLGVFIDTVILVLTDLLQLKNNSETILNSDRRDDLQKISAKFDARKLLIMTNMLTQIKKNSFLNPNYNLLFKSALISYGF
jgi:DNA polymerase III gamma/tau subunit